MGHFIDRRPADRAAGSCAALSDEADPNHHALPGRRPVRRHCARDRGKAAPEAGQPFVVENRPGANQIVAATTAMSAPPDGYTLLWATVSLTSLNPHLLKKLPYDPDKSFTPVSLLYQTNEYLIVSSELGVDTLEQFIALAKSRPGAISYASFGTGTLGHLQGVALAKAAGIELNHVPYKGMASVVPDLMTSRVQAVFTSTWSVMSQIQDGRLKVLALAQDQRSSNMPTVPTYRERGIGLVMSAWLGLLAPAGTPAEIVDRICREIASVVKDPEFRANTDRQARPHSRRQPASRFRGLHQEGSRFLGPDRQGVRRRPRLRRGRRTTSPSAQQIRQPGRDRGKRDDDDQ
jgi:tripartite-type tricarboxylate transporter receptor subunit TctC